MITQSFSAKSCLKTKYQDEDLTDILRQPPIVIIGVDESSNNLLKDLGINSVFDLAHSQLFSIAKKITEEIINTNDLIAWFDAIPSDIVDDNKKQIKPDKLYLEPIESLRSVGGALGKKIREHLKVDTIRDLSFYTPYRFAIIIFHEAVGTNLGIEDDQERPPDLLPSSGRFATERIQYTKLVLDEIKNPGIPLKKTGDIVGEIIGRLNLNAEQKKLYKREALQFKNTIDTPKDISQSGQIDITTNQVSEGGFTTPAIGAIVTYTQSWYPVGQALGQLLHSVALAPGESTRIAMIDWNRRQKVNLAEGATESELLESSLSSYRSIYEVTKAVATELQTGKSESSASSFSEISGQSFGAGGQLGAAGDGMNIGLGFGYSWGEGKSRGGSSANSWSSTSGNRNIDAELSQNINASTHQNSSLVRNRFATVVKEVSFEEHSKISTRVVANYNHMHALTIEYFEVVQIYRTDVELSKVVPCLFIPMKPLDFKGQEIINQFREILSRNALNENIFHLLSSSIGQYIIKLIGQPFSIDPNNLNVIIDYITLSISNINKEDKIKIEISFSSKSKTNVVIDGIYQSRSPNGTYDTYKFDIRSLIYDLRISEIDQLDIKYTYSEEYSRKRRIFVHAFQLAFINGNAEGFTGKIEIYNSENKKGDMIVLALLRVTKVDDFNELYDHLQLNSLYYSQAIWRNLDASRLMLLFNSYTYEGKPLLNLIDPIPVDVVGNYLIFRFPGYLEKREWTNFINRTNLKIGSKNSTLIPIPSGGVFAEAILGRSNSAEKLDITRFWNWQDSPIPILPTDIAPIQQPTPSVSDDTKTPTLGPANLQIMNPISMPDPTGMTSILGAIQNGNMFRDMSGLLSTIALAQSALNSSYAASQEGGKQAIQALSTAAQMASSAMNNISQQQKPTPAMDNISKVGSVLNEGEKMDRVKSANSNNQQQNTNSPSPESPQSSYKSDAFKQATGTTNQTPTLPTPNQVDTTSPKPQTKEDMKVKLIDVHTTLRVFVPTPAWMISSEELNLGKITKPSLIQAIQSLIGFKGNERGFKEQNTKVGDNESLASIDISLKLNPKSFEIFESTTKTSFGAPALYLFTKLESDNNLPKWGKVVKPKEEFIEHTTEKLDLDNSLIDGQVEKNGEKIILVLYIKNAKPYLPIGIIEGQLNKFPDFELGVELGIGFSMNWKEALNALYQQFFPGINAQIIITITKRSSDNALEFDTRISHDPFPAYELYVNEKIVDRYFPGDDAIEKWKNSTHYEKSIPTMML